MFFDRAYLCGVGGVGVERSVGRGGDGGVRNQPYMQKIGATTVISTTVSPIIQKVVLGTAVIVCAMVRVRVCVGP